MDQPHRTSLTNSADRLTSKDVAVFAPRRHHRWLSAELSCQPSATGLFRLLPLVSGTICHSTSRLQNLCLSSAVASRLISLGAAFRDTLTVVVPEKWLCLSVLVVFRSFGVVLWEMLTHEIPYKDVDSSAVIWGIGSNCLHLPVPSTGPDGLKLLMRQCWYVSLSVCLPVCLSVCLSGHLYVDYIRNYL